MKSGGDTELSGVTELVERGGVRNLLIARASLIDAAGELMDTAIRESRGLKADELRRMDAYMMQVGTIYRSNSPS